MAWSLWDGGRFLFQPAMTVIHDFEGWAMERDIRCHIGWATIGIHQIDPGLPLFTRQSEFTRRIREIARSQPFEAAVINGGDMLRAINELPPEMPRARR